MNNDQFSDETEHSQYLPDSLSNFHGKTFKNCGNLFRVIIRISVLVVIMYMKQGSPVFSRRSYRAFVMAGCDTIFILWKMKRERSLGLLICQNYRFRVFYICRCKNRAAISSEISLCLLARNTIAYVYLFKCKLLNYSVYDTFHVKNGKIWR